MKANEVLEFSEAAHTPNLYTDPLPIQTSRKSILKSVTVPTNTALNIYEIVNRPKHGDSKRISLLGSLDVDNANATVTANRGPHQLGYSSIW
jgi:hypothetical protein